MAKKQRDLPRVDHDALVRCVSLYKRLSPRAAAELSAMILRVGWHAGACHTARRLQQISLGLGQFEAAPCELKEQTIGGIKQLWMVDPSGVDQRRGEMVMVLKQLLHYGLSRYEPHPPRAIEAAEMRRQAPSGDAA
jgi:hypothetical protein